MGRFKNLTTEVVVVVDDAKDDRFGPGWERVEAEKPKPKK